MPTASRARYVTAAILAAAVIWLYSGVIPGWVRQWAQDEDYSHGFFVLPLAAYFVWERREALLAARRRPSIAGLVLLVFSLLMFVAGQFGAELFLSRVSLIGVLTALVLFILGRDHARILAFPLGFLLLMVPLPEILFSRIAFPLQLVASRIGEAAIATAGVPVLREGNVLVLPGRTLEVAEACSGIRSLITLVMLAIVLGYFSERRISGRVLIALAAIPIAVAANAARVAGTGLASYWVGPAAAEGFFHGFSGWMMFVTAFAGLLAVHRVIDAARLRLARAGEAAC